MNLEEGPFVFRVNDNGAGPNLLIQVCMERGWREYTDCPMIRDNWNLWWKTSAFTVSQHKNLKAWQFTNHIPKGASICRKDNLARNLKCMRRVYGSVYDISPIVYHLPLEYTKLVADCSRNKDEENQKVWICKPVGQSQGRGIFLFKIFRVGRRLYGEPGATSLKIPCFNVTKSIFTVLVYKALLFLPDLKNLSDLCYDSNAVVQRYIKNPLLIGGYKFDLRLYVCVPSYHPLTIYLYKEGIVRFSTDKFSLTDLNNPFCHLTNSSLNKLGPGYAEQKDRIGAGCKWSFKQLRHYFQQAGINDWLLWQKISALITLTILSQSTSVPQTTNCFEFYGFDVLVDEKLKPWLLEVNLSPALGNDCDVDPVVKKPLLHDLFDLLGLPVCNTGLSLFTIYTPYDAKSQSLCLLHSENEDDSENKKIGCIKGKSKFSMSLQSNCSTGKFGNSKATSASALIVATAATKWRRKRKTNYLFGPPNKNNSEQLKKNSENVKKSHILVQEICDRNKPQSKAENDKNVRKLPEANYCNIGKERTNESVKPKQIKKCLATKKRERENKIKVCGSMNCIADRLKPKYENSCTASCVDSSKIAQKSPIIAETGADDADDNGKIEKKAELPLMEVKHQKQKSEYKSTAEKIKRVSLGESSNVKSVLLPFDKSQAAYRGFRGRTRQPPPMLWGNGRDWRTPVHHEGDWGRIYPLNHNCNSKDVPRYEEDHMGNKFTVGDKQIRLVVHHVTKFIKICKQLYSSGLYSTEEELNAQLMKNLGLTGEVWLPSK